jgi:predicted phosphodiesterase
VITAVLTSDNHLGAYYARMSPDRLERRRRALQLGFERVVDAALERRVDLFLHAGDLFDRPDPRNADRWFVARQMSRLRAAGIQAFAVTGNHDRSRGIGYDGGATPQDEIHALDALRLFRGGDRWDGEEFVLKGQRVRVRGMSADFNRPPGECPLEELSSGDERGGDIDIALLHYGVEGWSPKFAEEPCLKLANLSGLKADIIGVGHLHRRNEARLPSGALLVNPGGTERIHFGEENLECGYWALNFQPGGVSGEYVHLPVQPMRTLNLEWDEAGPDSDAASPATLERFLMEIEQASGLDQLLRLRLSGRIPRDSFRVVDMTALHERGSALNFYCQIVTENLAVYDPLQEWTLSFGGSFDAGQELESMAEAMGREMYGDRPDEQEICRKAGEAVKEAYARLTGGAR